MTTAQVLTGRLTIQEISSETRKLYEHLKNLKVGEVVTYAALSELVGRDVSKEAVGSLATARRMCQREHHIVYGAVRGIGLQRLDDKQIVNSADNEIAKIQRTAARGVKKLACVDYANLAVDDKSNFNAKAAALGTLLQHSQPSAVKQLERHYANEQQPVLPRL